MYILTRVNLHYPLCNEIPCTRTLINKQGIWTSPKDVTWEIKRLSNWEDKGKIGYKVSVSVTNNSETNDQNVPLDEKATNNSKKQGLVENVVNKIPEKVQEVVKEGVEKVKMVWSKMVEKGKKFLRLQVAIR